jgi:hypothetical protein
MNRAQCKFYLTEVVSAMIIIGSLTGNMLPPFAVRLMFGVSDGPLALENAATYQSGLDRQAAICENENLSRFSPIYNYLTM